MQGMKDGERAVLEGRIRRLSLQGMAPVDAAIAYLDIAHLATVAANRLKPGCASDAAQAAYDALWALSGKRAAARANRDVA